jgi:hypothetical protein
VGKTRDQGLHGVDLPDHLLHLVEGFLMVLR